MSEKYSENDYRKAPRKRDYESFADEKLNSRRERDKSDGNHRRRKNRFEDKKDTSRFEPAQKWIDRWDPFENNWETKEKKEEFLSRTTNLAISLNLNSDITQPSQMKKKIYFPNDGFNYIGLLIGPKGMFQKKLENETGWKILIRGRGSKKEGQARTPEDNEDQHVVIISDKEENLNRGYEKLSNIINSDLETKERIRNEQLKVGAECNINMNQVTSLGEDQFDTSMMTNDGPPNLDDYQFVVPNDWTGLIIGKKGDKIKSLQAETGAKIKVAKAKINNTEERNIFIEGTEEQKELAKIKIKEIVEDWRVIHNQKNWFSIRNHEDPFQVVPVPESIIETLTKYKNEPHDISNSILQNITEKYFVKIYVPPYIFQNTGNRNIEVSGK